MRPHAYLFNRQAGAKGLNLSVPVKFLIIVVGLAITLNCKAQNLRLLNSFDNITLGSARYEAEGYMVNINEYVAKPNNYNYDNYTYSEYYSKDSSTIMLCFYKGILYLKRLQIKYSTKQMQLAKEESENIKKYILSNNKITSQNSADLTQGTYGTIGKSYSFYINSNPKINKVKTVDFSGTLDVSGDKKPFTFTLIGYQVNYESVDLSKTELNVSKGGYSSVQN